MSLKNDMKITSFSSSGLLVILGEVFKTMSIHQLKYERARYQVRYHRDLLKEWKAEDRGSWVPLYMDPNIINMTRALPKIFSPSSLSEIHNIT